MDDPIAYSAAEPDNSLHEFVESFWVLHEQEQHRKQIVILPDGRIDLFFSYSPAEPFHARLMGLTTKPDLALLEPGTTIFAVSFRPPAAEYILRMPVADILNHTRQLADGFWNIMPDDLTDLKSFSKILSQKIREQLQDAIDPRKQKLFEGIYESQGNLSVQALADRAAWSSRQINRYFQQWFGMSLKAYCSILRFRASFGQIHEGKFFPEQKFADQPHFIREIKRFSGVNPKELFKNTNDRFIQFSLLKGK
jgi:AraC-like DNA-binding protein